jgi:hypothetical protein
MSSFEYSFKWDNLERTNYVVWHENLTPSHLGAKGECSSGMRLFYNGKEIFRYKQGTKFSKILCDVDSFFLNLIRKRKLDAV